MNSFTETFWKHTYLKNLPFHHSNRRNTKVLQYYNAPIYALFAIHDSTKNIENKLYVKNYYFLI